jgi:hypothetical protein
MFLCVGDKTRRIYFMKNTKKFISIVLAMLLLVSVFSISFTANAADAKKTKTSDDEVQYIASGNYRYYLNDDGNAVIDSYYGNENNLVIPSTLDGHTVVCIDSDTFYDCENIENIQIPDSVKSIGSDAFYGTGYYNNEDNWENGVLYIGKFLIKATNMTGTYTIKNGTTVIADYAFYEWYQDENYDDEEYNEDYIGRFSELEGVVIPSSVTYIGQSAFSSCDKLTNVTLSDGLKYIGYSAFGYCSALKSITIPNSVTTIDASAFCECTSLENVTLSNGIKEISYELFDGCSNLNNIVIPNSVTSIDTSAFSSCSSLNNITIPSSVTEMGDSAFSGTGIYNNASNWTNGTLYFGRFLLDSNATVTPGSYTVKSGTEVIAGYALSECSNITSVTFPNSVKYINYCAFYKCVNLEEVTIGGNVKEIGSYAFENTALKRVTIPANVTTIGKCALGYYEVEVTNNDEYTETIDTKVADFTINGYAGTAAETYANENGFTFNKLTPPPAPKTTTKTKKDNTLKVSAKTKAVKAKKLKKKKQTVKPLKIKNAKGAVTVTKVKKGSAAKLFKKITVNKKTGAITIKKGKYAKKTYKIKLKVTAAGTSAYKKGEKTVTIKVKVK